MAKPPIIDEREFLKLTRNHGEFCQKLRLLGLPAASTDLVENAYHVGLSWLRLADEHMKDGKVAANAGGDRASYSRSYYAAYNASKSVRYIVTGAVSLTGDDHRFKSTGRFSRCRQMHRCNNQASRASTESRLRQLDIHEVRIFNHIDGGRSIGRDIRI
jgi:hypothetical protein